MTFGAATGLTKRLAAVASYKGVILDFTDVTHIDDSAALALETIVNRATEADQTVILTGLRRPVVRSFIRYGMLHFLKRCARFHRRLDAIEHACKLFANDQPEPED